MKKKPSKESKPTPEYDPRREQNVLLEEIRVAIADAIADVLFRDTLRGIR